MNKIHTNKLIMTLLMSLIYGVALAQGIAFKTENWQAIKTKAKAENKLIFVDVYTTWCGPCKQMDKNIFSDEKVGAFYNTNFIPFKMDAEKGEGVSFAKEYTIRGYPCLLFIDGDGKQINRRNRSFSSTGDFLKFGKETLDSEKEFTTASSLYSNGKRDPEFILKYLSLLKARNLPTEEIALSYFDNIEQKNWTSSENLKLIHKYLHSPYSPVIAYLEKNKESFATVQSSLRQSQLKRVYNTIYRLYQGYLYSNIAKNRGNKERDAVFLSHIKSNLYPVDADRLTFLTKRVIFGSDKDWKSYAEVIIDYVNKHHLVNANALGLNECAYLFYRTPVTDERSLNLALNWVNTALESTNKDNRTYSYYLDTQASLLYKLGRKKEALEVAYATIESAKKLGNSYKDTLILIKKIKAI